MFISNQSKLLYVDQNMKRFEASVYLEALGIQRILTELLFVRVGRDGHVWAAISSSFNPLSTLHKHDDATPFNEAFCFHGVSCQFPRVAASTTAQLHAPDMRCHCTEF